MKTDFDIVIVGGSLVGCYFALNIARLKPQFKIAIIDVKHAEIDQSLLQANYYDDLDQRIYAITPENVYDLETFGAWPGNEDRIGSINKMDVYGDDNAHIVLERNMAKAPFLAKIVEAKLLLQAMLVELQNEEHVQFISDELLDIVDETSLTKFVGKKYSYTSQIIVAADGANSKVRQIKNLNVKALDYNEFGIVANFSCEYPHYNTAYQWFNTDGVLAYLPLSYNKISIVWSTGDYESLLKLPKAEFTDLVATSGKHKLGKLEMLSQKAVGFPLILKMMERTYANRCVFIGDAAHTIHPLAGHGVNLGFSDAKLLAQTLSKYQSYQLADCGVLAKFSSSRQLQVKKMQLTCHLLRNLFKAENPVIRVLRNKGMNWLDGFTGIKKILINQV